LSETAQPTSTGEMAAGKVLGRLASSQRLFMGSEWRESAVMLIIVTASTLPGRFLFRDTLVKHLTGIYVANH
ncbi:MAG: hypothetical protein AAGU05_08230, partial [Anaerolineaceae bacterium]